MKNPWGDEYTPDQDREASEASQEHQSDSLFVSSQGTQTALGQEQLFRSIWEHAADAMVLSDAQGIVLLANPAYYQLYGYTPAEVVGQHFAVIFPPAQRAIALEQYSAVFQSAPAQSIHEGLIQRADGTVRIVESRIDFLMHNGARSAMLSIIRDITERKQVEHDLREHAETVESIHRISQMLSAELDLQRLVQAVTDAATTLTGAAFGAFFYNLVDEQGERYTLYTLAGVAREAFDPFPMPRNTHIFGPTFRGEGIIRLGNVHEDPRYAQNPPYFGMPKDHLPVVSYMAVPVISRSGEVLGGLFFGHPDPDIFSERAERIAGGLAAQTAIALDNAHLFRQAQAAARLRDQFLSIASHELKTPLTALLGYAQLLERRTAQEGLLPARDQHALGVIVAQATRLSKLIATLLDISRIDQGQLKLNQTLLDIAGLVWRVAADIQPALERHNLVYDMPSQPLWIKGDELRLEQVLHNLIDNAVKYSPKGGTITIDIRQSDDYARLVIADEGMGIPEQALPLLFQRFYRADNVDDQHISGVGIGLYIVQEIVTLHGGIIKVESVEQHGSTFTICLPLYARPATPNVLESDR
jgi:PAS domain S-box-containing protein